jgi:hypothetical protein
MIIADETWQIWHFILSQEWDSIMKVGQVALATR